VDVPVVPAIASVSVPAPSMSFSAGRDRTPVVSSLTLSQTAQADWNLTAEEERKLLNGGTNSDILMQTVQQGWRSIRNQIEAYTCAVAIANASRAVGTAGTTPFASDFNLTADVVKILDDNGANGGDRTLVINTAAAANLRKNSVLYKASEAGTADMLRQGIIGDLNGLKIRQSAGITNFVKGTATGALVNAGGGLAVGTTVIPFDTATPGATGIKAGDVISFAGDTVNKYVVKTGLVAASGNITIQEPGLLVTIPDNNAITVENNYAGNVALERSALVVVARPLLQPESADVEQMVVSDPVTGLSALMMRKVGDQMASWYMRVVYDAFAPNGYGIATLRG
jgi:hypothetical protein